MKLKRLLILPTLLLSISVVGCKKDKPSEETDYPVIEFDPDDYICSGGNYSGYFLEINVGRKICSESSYDLYFESSYTADPSYTISISVPALADYTKVDNNSFTLNTTKYTGDFILKIENAQGLLVYRNVVRVRKAVPVEEVGQKLYEMDTFKSDASMKMWLGEWRLLFTESSPISGTLTGGDDMEQNVNISFQVDEFVEYIAERDVYYYTVTETSSTASTTNLAGFQVSRTLDVIYLYESSGLLTIVYES